MLRGVAAGWPTRMKRPTAARTDSYLSRMVTYIPTEIIAGYVAVSGFIKTLPAPRQFAWFCAVTLFLLVLTPLYLRYATAKSGRKRNVSHPLTGTIAFAAWVFATGGPFERYQMSPDGSTGWYTRAIGSIVLVVICLALPVIQRVLSREDD